MPLQNTAGLIRVGILALPIGGLLVLVGTLFILGVPSPEDNPTVAAKTNSRSVDLYRHTAPTSRSDGG